MNRRGFLLKYILIFIAIILGLVYSKETVKKIMQSITSYFGIEEEEKAPEVILEEKLMELRDLRINKTDWINVRQPPFNLPGDGSDQTEKLQELFDLGRDNGSVYLYFPEGDYGVSRYIRLYKNTFVHMHVNAKIIRLGNRYQVFVNGEVGNNAYALRYNGEGNIHFHGGTIDLNAKGAPIPKERNLSAFDLSHGENISFTNLTIENGQNGHYFQIASCKKVLFDNCHLRNNIYTNSKSKLFEAIQIEIATHKTFPAFGGYDGTISRDIIIEKCTFENVIRGIGTHGDVRGNIDKVAYCENIRILNNDFDGSVDNMLNLTAYKNTVVENNIIKNAGGYGINLVNFYESSIRGNTVIGSVKSGIFIQGSHNNLISKNYYKDVCVREKSNFSAILLESSSNNVFEGDTVFSSKPNYTYAFYLQGGSGGNKISSHNFTRGTKGLINGVDSSEMDNIQIGAGQIVLYDGAISVKGSTNPLLEDIRNFSSIVVVGNDNSSNTAQITTIVIPKLLILIGDAKSRYRIVFQQTDSPNSLEFSFPTATTIRMDNIQGVANIRKVIGMC